MLITRLKSKDEILAPVNGNTAIISCEGCSEVWFPVSEAADVQKELSAGGAVSALIITDYICNPEHLELQLQKHIAVIEAASLILVFSCGVGVQTVADRFPGVSVFAACDTLPLPGWQGVTPLEYDCAQCGECRLNDTGGICPITSCSKSLVNGQCGGAQNGKCEVDKDMDCGWERIYSRLEKLEQLDALSHPVRIRDFSINT